MSTLYVFGGLPGTGKSTLARRLCGDLRALYVRIDTIEDALLASGCKPGGPEGYVVAYGIAAENLRLGSDVVADCVNPLGVTRSSWQAVAADCGARLVEIEVGCSNAEEHRRRIESRQTGKPLSWREVVEREYERWDAPTHRVDTAGRAPDASYAELRRLLRI